MTLLSLLKRLEWAGTGAAYASETWGECPLCGGLPEEMRRRVEGPSREELELMRPTTRSLAESDKRDWSHYHIGHSPGCELAEAIREEEERPTTADLGTIEVTGPPVPESLHAAVRELLDLPEGFGALGAIFQDGVLTVEVGTSEETRREAESDPDEGYYTCPRCGHRGPIEGSCECACSRCGDRGHIARDCLRREAESDD